MDSGRVVIVDVCMWYDDKGKHTKRELYVFGNPEKAEEFINSICPDGVYTHYGASKADNCRCDDHWHIRSWKNKQNWLIDVYQRRINEC